MLCLIVLFSVFLLFYYSALILVSRMLEI